MFSSSSSFFFFFISDGKWTFSTFCNLKYTLRFRETFTNIGANWRRKWIREMKVWNMRGMKIGKLEILLLLSPEFSSNNNILCLKEKNTHTYTYLFFLFFFNPANFSILSIYSLVFRTLQLFICVVGRLFFFWFCFWSCWKVFLRNATRWKVTPCTYWTVLQVFCLCGIANFIYIMYIKFAFFRLSDAHRSDTHKNAQPNKRKKKQKEKIRIIRNTYNFRIK